jgi:hypothetical protein
MEGAASEAPLVGFLPLLCYSHTCCTASLVVELTYAGFILTYIPFIDVELIGKEG